MALIPPSFLFRVAHPCLYVQDLPRPDDDRLLDLPTACRLHSVATLDGRRDFADVTAELEAIVTQDIRALDGELRGRKLDPIPTAGAAQAVNAQPEPLADRVRQTCDPNRVRRQPAGRPAAPV